MILGIYPHEVDTPQSVVLNITASVDDYDLVSEQLGDGIDYDKIRDIAKKLAVRPYKLQENFVHDVIQAIMAVDGRIRKVICQLAKKHIHPDCQVGITVTAER
ncbi:MAG: dihydroneopterin aldolase [Aquitalea sp.]|nr:dihydroneopterin aldolase [Aquitalea sp.]